MNILEPVSGTTSYYGEHVVIGSRIEVEGDLGIGTLVVPVNQAQKFLDLFKSGLEEANKLRVEISEGKRMVSDGEKMVAVQFPKH